MLEDCSGGSDFPAKKTRWTGLQRNVLERIKNGKYCISTELYQKQFCRAEREKSTLRRFCICELLSNEQSDEVTTGVPMPTVVQ